MREISIYIHICIYAYMCIYIFTKISEQPHKLEISILNYLYQQGTPDSEK